LAGCDILCSGIYCKWQAAVKYVVDFSVNGQGVVGYVADFSVTGQGEVR